MKHTFKKEITIRLPDIVITNDKRIKPKIINDGRIEHIHYELSDTSCIKITPIFNDDNENMYEINSPDMCHNGDTSLGSILIEWMNNCGYYDYGLEPGQFVLEYE